MISVNILGKGDSVLTVNDRFAAVKRKSGEVDIFNLFFTDDGIYIDPVKTATIGFGCGVVEKQLDDGETSVYSF